MHLVRDALFDDEGGAGVTRARTAIVGVGSPFGDDRAGWLVVDALSALLDEQARAAAGLLLAALDRPGAMLLEALGGVDRAVVVDAVVCGEAAGTVIEMDAAGLGKGARFSSHGFGVAEALALGAALGRLPRELRVVGIAVDAVSGSAEVSEAVRSGVERVAAELRGWALVEERSA